MVGDVITSGRGRVDHLFSAFQAELIACLQGIQVAADLGINNLLLETDATEVNGGRECSEVVRT